MRVARSSETITPYLPVSEQPAAQASASGTPAEPSSFGTLLHGLGRELDQGEAMSEKAIRGGGSVAHLSPESLLALQAGIYRYSEAVDLVTKLVDRATQAVKTTLQNP